MNDFKLLLFYTKKEFFLFCIFIGSIFFVNLYFEYAKFQKLIAGKFYKTEAVITSQYHKFNKNNKKYHVLKLKSVDGFKCITTNYEDLKDLNGRLVSLVLITKNITFFEFLRGFYAPAFDIRLYQKEEAIKSTLVDLVKSQHEYETTKSLFAALFFAETIPKDLRDAVQFWGISHLIAISGFHLGVLFGILYFIFYKIYAFFQDRYFPYRNARFDLTIVIIGILFMYLYMLDFVPSLLRSFVMMCLGFFFYVRSMEILSFQTLLLTVLTVLAIVPNYLLSIGFWFSVSGVFYIYLFLHYFNHLKNWQIFILLNVWVYFMMMPIVHYIFPVFSFYQLTSPVISMAFILFYPFEMLLHLINLGSLIDSSILDFLSVQGNTYMLNTPFLFLLSYVAISLAAIFHIFFLYLLIIINAAFLFFI